MSKETETRLFLWRVLDSRGLGFHSSWSVGRAYSHLRPEEVEVVEVVPQADLARAEAEVERLRDATQELADASADLYIHAKMDPGKPKNTAIAVRFDNALQAAQAALTTNEMKERG